MLFVPLHVAERSAAPTCFHGDASAAHHRWTARVLFPMDLSDDFDQVDLPDPTPDKDSSDEDGAGDSDEDSKGFVGDWKPRKVDTPASGNSRGGSARAGRKTTSSCKEDSNSDDSMS